MKNRIFKHASLILLLFLISIPVMAAKPDAKKDKYEPVYAQDIKLVKKQKALQIDIDSKAKVSTPPGLDKAKPDESSDSVAAGFLGEGLAEGARKYALLIGICDYPGTVNDICLSDGDATNTKKALIEKYGYQENDIILLRDMNATYDAITNAIEDITSQLQAGDEFVFFYSGHGTSGMAMDDDKERKDEGLYVHNGVSGMVIWDGQLASWFADLPGVRTAFIFDTCLAGGMDDVAQDGRLLVMSSAERENSYVWSNGEEGEGVFSHYFINKGILQENAKVYDYSAVSLEESFDYSVAMISTQNPQVEDHYSGDYIPGN